MSFLIAVSCIVGGFSGMVASLTGYMKTDKPLILCVTALCVLVMFYGMVRLRALTSGG